MGNVRELQNCLERAVILCKNQMIEYRDLLLDQARLSHTSPHMNISISAEGISLQGVERSLIIDALSLAGGNQSRAASLLKITRNTLRYRMEKYGLNPNA